MKNTIKKVGRIVKPKVHSVRKGIKSVVVVVVIHPHTATIAGTVQRFLS